MSSDVEKIKSKVFNSNFKLLYSTDPPIATEKNFLLFKKTSKNRVLSY